MSRGRGAMAAAAMFLFAGAASGARADDVVVDSVVAVVGEDPASESPASAADAIAEAQAGSRPGRAGARVLAVDDDGAAVDARAWWRGGAGRLRHDRRGANGWLSWAGRGALKGVIVGGVRPSMGNGLVLGGYRSRFAPVAQPAGAVGLSAATSASLWRVRRGVAVVIGYGATRACAVYWRDDGRGAWGGLDHSGEGWAVGLAAGSVRARADGADRRGLVLVGRAGRGASSARAEVAWWDRQILASARVGAQGRSRWAAELGIRRPGGRLGEVVSPAASAGSELRMAVGRSGRTGSIRHRVTLWSVVERSSSRERHLERVQLNANGGTARGRIQVDLRATRAQALARSRETAVTASASDDETAAELRVRYETVQTAPSHRIDAWVVRTPSGAGVAVGWRLGFRAGPAELDAQALGASLLSGQVLTASRPGLSGRGSFVVLTGCETDLCAGLGVRGGRRLQCAWLVLGPGREVARTLVSVHARL